MKDFQPHEFEAKWIKKWNESKLYQTPTSVTKQSKKYILDMFPYPSGSKLHVGHPHGYIATDIMARYMRMKGYCVLHPMGWDAFGLPAENYAIKTGIHPRITTDKAINDFKNQIQNMALSYDWEHEIATHRPEYYKWTQWLFLLLYKKGLAYRKEAPVNYCPHDQTVLANEQVVNGKCERCDHEVIQKNMVQWFFKITDYVERLISGLDHIDWPESTKSGQINWIGKSEGTLVYFMIDTHKIDIFTTRIDTLYGATYLVLAPEHPLVGVITAQDRQVEVKEYVNQAKKKTELERKSGDKEKTGVFTGAYGINPINGEKLPVWIADFVIATYGSGALFADAHDERDFMFAKKYNIPLRTTIKPLDDIDNEQIKNLEVCFTGDGVLYDSGPYSGMKSAEARHAITAFLQEKGFGKAKTMYKLRDWLVSRQRYWGAPIPIIYCNKCGIKPVAEPDLPVLLPEDVDFNPTGKSPLTYSESFQEGVNCPSCGAKARREVDTMDTFVDSSWYFLRFIDPKNKEAFADKDKLATWMPIDLYVGGAEHTVLHLLYARFFTKVLYDEGYLTTDEPFQQLRHQGTILASDGRKMSKRWGNVINPDSEIEKFGADTVRLYEMFMGPFKETKAWTTQGEHGVFRFLNRVWTLHNKVDSTFESAEQLKIVHKLIKQVTEGVESFHFNTTISKYMEFVNFLSKESKINKSVWERFLILLSPFAPFITEELWSDMGNSYSIHQQPWPIYDKEQIEETEVSLVVQVNGKVRAAISLPLDTDEAFAVEKAKENERVQKYIVAEPKKVIFVKNKILNFIV